MAGKVCDDFYDEGLKAQLAGGSVVGKVLRLFSNNYTPVLNDSPSNYTQCTGSGYASISLSSGSWTVTKVGNQEQATYPQQTFTFTGALTVYGYYVTDSGNTKVFWAELASGGPFTYGAGGGQLLVTLELDGPAS